MYNRHINKQAGAIIMFILLIVLYTGKFQTIYYPNHAQCEAALIEQTDFGRYKKIQTAKCIKG